MRLLFLVNRSCTDIICCILFILALLGYFAVGILAWSQGDPRKVIYPTDSKGQFCGQVGTPLENKPLLFYFNIMKCASPLVLLEFQCPTTQICVEKCPTKFMTLVKALQDDKDRDYYKQFCKEGVDMTKRAPEILKNGLCPSILTPSKNFTRRCLPALETLKGGIVVIGNKTTFTDEKGDSRNATDLLDASKKSNVVVEARAVAMRIFEDYTQSWHWILLGLVIAMLVSLIFILLLRCLAGVMIWVMIIMVIIVIGYGIFHCYMQYASLKGQAGSDVTIKDLGLQTDFSVYLQIQQTWLAFMIILCIVEVVIILLLIFLRKRLLIAIALIKEASKFLSTSNEPVYKVFNTTECMYSRETCNPETFNSSNITTECPDAECLFAFYGGETLYHKYLILFQFYNLFLFFWCVNFVTALGQVTLAGAFASYYWAFKKPDDIPAYPVFNSLGRALRYHTGTLAFGSLILAIVQIIRVILEYLDQKLKGAQNKCAKFLLSCLKCCFWCLEKFIKFLNRNAYIMVAIYGKNFCTSAKDAFFLLMRNIVRVVVLDKVTDFLLFLGKLLIVGIVGICSFFFFTGKFKMVQDVAPSLNYYWVPILTVVVGAYLIAHGFFSVYAMCVDTLFLCFCEDLERNDGSSDKPFFMSPELHQILSIEKNAEETDNAEIPVIQVQAEEEVPLQENGEVQFKEQEVLKQEQEEETPLNQETHIEEPPQETQPPEAPVAAEEKPEEQVTTQEPEPPQVTPQQNGPQEVDAEDKEEQAAQPQAEPPQAENLQEQEPEEPKPQENGPQESETLLTPQE
ncbi:Choline transporter-like protein 2 [Anabarilius grahami]|uniref:Choline transporter-like protein n=1 Tax=Anabarilius grahami TaxID=495550 RepID=A0A3N0Y695_ANAGA|nr:Choline transporter-like protein 2 [Anabarilius grahami]